DEPEPVECSRYQPEEQVDLVLSFIGRQSSADSPWCMFLSWGPPHGPFDPPPTYRAAHDGKPLRANVPPGEGTDFARKNQPGYHGLIASLDVSFGRLMDGLEASGQADNTIVVYTSDHGEMMGSQGCRAKRWPHDESIRIPLIVRYPDVIPAGTSTDQPVSAMDFFPTLCDLAGLTVPPDLDGVSAATLFRNGRDEHREEFAYCPMHYGHVPWPGWRAVVNARWTYAETIDGPWVMFDNLNDPLQMHNLVNIPAASSDLQFLRDVLRTKMQEAGDSWDFRLDTGDFRKWEATRK
ncbi:MAG: sulfatase-like hydrolase/transferase, partial [Lentisphaerae bacterium]|nr:sulfatase-like hydrolase/transferase [Lentisphaerota bacterium]